MCLWKVLVTLFPLVCSPEPFSRGAPIPARRLHTLPWVVVGQIPEPVPIALRRSGAGLGDRQKVMFMGHYWHYASLASEALCPQAHMALCQAQ